MNPVHPPSLAAASPSPPHLAYPKLLHHSTQIPRPVALDLLIQQPALAFDFTAQDIAGRLEALSKIFQV